MDWGKEKEIIPRRDVGNERRSKQTEELLKLIKANETSPTWTTSELLKFAEFFKNLKGDSKYGDFLSVIRRLSDKIEEFTGKDYDALTSFLSESGLTDDYGTFLLFAQKKDRVKGVDNQALFLKLLNTISNKGQFRPTGFLDSYQNVKEKYSQLRYEIFANIDSNENTKTVK